jgi:hypothetical protein
MQRSCADVNSPINESAELTQGALLLILYSEIPLHLSLSLSLFPAPQDTCAKLLCLAHRAETILASIVLTTVRK